MPEFESSIVIPVFNKWELTRNCLKSLAATTDREKVEVIVVDNASSDVTARACAPLGRQLFGDSFRYVRNCENRNFAGASNQGAALAGGRFLIFLNNDTVAEAGWYQPLIDDFSIYPDIAATGPLLVYPEQGPLGRAVQHLGILVSPFMRMGHLYEGIPETSPLARKRRFFQAITGACMVIPRALFMDVGCFDEGYVNGYEDVDLCGRLKARGLRMTVNPASVVVHLEGQTPGRHDRDEGNFKKLSESSQKLFKPDWHALLENDNLFLDVNEWGLFQVRLPAPLAIELNHLAQSANGQSLKEMVIQNPYWENGWRALAASIEPWRDRAIILKSVLKLFRNGKNGFIAYEEAQKARDVALRKEALDFLLRLTDTPQDILQNALGARAWSQQMNLPRLAERYESWIKNYPGFVESIYAPFSHKLLELEQAAKIVLNPTRENDYNIWRYGCVIPRQKKYVTPPKPESAAAFSIIMPVYNPDPEYFRAALDSILAQTNPNWELCLADDASPNPETRRIIEEYTQRDPRIRAAFRAQNGHIAAATNTALEMAANPWCVFVDQDDALSRDALAVMADWIVAHPNGLLFYSDEDKLGPHDLHYGPYFKNGKWDWELLRAQNFVCHLAAYRTDRLRDIGGLREGFAGAQDYDLLLRYVAGANAKELVHVPRILYHWRAHEKSTASDVGAKEYALDNSLKAAQANLDAVSPGARAALIPGLRWMRTHYPLPAQRPLASIICEAPNADFDIMAHAGRLAKTTGYPHEMIYVCKESDSERLLARCESLHDKTGSIRLVTCDMPGAAALNEGATHARGDILGFVAPDMVQAGQDWLEELVSALWRPLVGVVGGGTALADNLLFHAGYLADASGTLKRIFAGAPWNRPRNFAWNVMARTVDALDSASLFTRKEVFDRAGGMDLAMGDWAAQDYCLRLGEDNLRSVWWPFARFTIGTPGKAGRIAPRAFQERWQGRLTPFNPNLEIVKDAFSLVFGKNEK